MNEQATTDLIVKIFIGHEQPAITPVGNLAEARTLFNRWASDEACESVYVYRGTEIIASWDRSTEYLLAIGDIEIDEDGCIDGDLYGDHGLYGDVQP